MSASPRDDLPVVVIGAGPVGLAAAAHLLERGLEPPVLEAGDQPAAVVRSWGHVRLFSPWEYDVDAAAARLLASTGRQSPDPAQLPTGAELVERYRAPLAATPTLAGRIRTGTRVLAVSRVGVDKTRTLGRESRAHLVRTVVDGRVQDLTALVGMGHSAATTLLARVGLRQAAPGTRITWAIRGRSPARLYGGDSDGLPARAETAGLGFATGRAHGHSAEEPEPAGCCGPAPQPVTIGAPASGC